MKPAFILWDFIYSEKLEENKRKLRGRGTSSGTYIYVKIQQHRYIQNGIHSEIQQNWYMYIVIMIQRDWCMYSYLQIQQSWCMCSYLEKQQSWCMYTVSYRYNGTSVSIQLLQIQQNQFMYSYYRYNGTGACIQLFRETIELIHIYSYYDTIEVVHVSTQLQIQWYRCMYAVITDTIELVHVYSYSLMYLQIQQNWCMYTVFYRQNGTGAYIQLFSIIFTDTIELVHIYSYFLLYLQSQQNWCNMYSYSLLYLQIQQNWCMYIVIY